MDNRFGWLIAGVFSVLIALNSAWGMDLSSYRWQKRLLLVFSPSDSTPVYADFKRNIQTQMAEVNDRDLVLFTLFEKGVSHLDGKALSSQDAQALRDRFGIAPGRFTVVLIGKDGGVKLVSKDRIDLRQVFDLIDSMPMRQQEMRAKERS